MSTETRVTTMIEDGIASITMDDGKVNVLSPAMQGELHEALDAAESAGASVVVLSGRERVFCAGFDLAVFQEDGKAGPEMVMGGFDLARRLLSFPRPILMVSRGHAIAMGAFLFLTGDHRLAVSDHGIYTANEVAIGMTLPHSALELLRHRLTPAAFSRAALLAERFDPADAVLAGFVDELVGPDGLTARTTELAQTFAQLDTTAHERSKSRARRESLARLDEAIAADRADLGL